MKKHNLFFDIPEETADENLTDYLIHCYLYYKLNNPIIYDYDFDELCKDLLSRWDSISHSYKDFVSYDDLKAGTGYSITEYPKDVIEEAERRKKIFLQELQHEIEIAKEIDKKEEFEFTNTPMETYLLCGMYRDFGFFKEFARNLEKQKEIGEELKRRWNNNTHQDEFQQYFEDHNITPEKLLLI
jgi:hypothetical protein